MSGKKPCVCPWGCFQKRLFESVDWVKQIVFPSVRETSSIRLRVWKEQKGRRENSPSDWRSWGRGFFLSGTHSSSTLESQAFGLGLELHRFVCSFIRWWKFRLFYFLSVVNNAAVNVCTRDFVWIYVFFSHGIILTCGIAESDGSCVFNILRNCQTVFSSDYTVLYPHQQSVSVPVLPIHVNTCYCLFFILAHLCGFLWTVSHCVFDFAFS